MLSTYFTAPLSSPRNVYHKSVILQQMSNMLTQSPTSSLLTPRYHLVTLLNVCTSTFWTPKCPRVLIMQLCRGLASIYSKSGCTRLISTFLSAIRLQLKGNFSLDQASQHLFWEYDSSYCLKALAPPPVQILPIWLTPIHITSGTGLTIWLTPIHITTGAGLIIWLTSIHNTTLCCCVTIYNDL